MLWGSEGKRAMWGGVDSKKAPYRVGGWEWGLGGGALWTAEGWGCVAGWEEVDVSPAHMTVIGCVGG